jgi:hypothetical protein
VISSEWRRWAGINLLRGVPLGEVIATMVASGLAEDESARACAELYAQPLFDIASELSQQLRKLESVLAVRETMLDLSDTGRAVPHRRGLSRQSFLDEFYARGQPVILDDACDQWPACSRWSPAYLAEVLGDQPVEVMTGRDADPDYEINGDAHKDTMPFDEYVSKVIGTDWSNDTYLVANNRLLESKAASALWKDFHFDDRFLRSDADRSLSFLWLGPAGTVTLLHHDVMNVMFHQVYGWKHFILVSPLETPRLYNNVSVYAAVDPKKPDLERFPAFAQAHPIHLTIGPGQALFIPAGWWHHVESLETSISVSTTSFVYANKIDWFHPEPVRS